MLVVILSHAFLATGIAVASALVLACGPAVSVEDGGDTGTEGNSTSGGDPSGSTGGSVPPDPSGDPPPPPTATASGTATTTSPGDTTESGSSFVGTGTGGVGFECSVIVQDCPDGEKCMPYANDGGNSWNDTKCVPIAPDPAGVGEPCHAEGSGVSGFDDCDGTSMCWDVDIDTLEGTCVPFCIGPSEAEAGCANECDFCSISSGPLALCFPICDPLAQDCDDGEGCYGYGDTFLCAPDASQQAGPAACEYINGCEPGYACVSGEALPACDAPGCCSPFCSTGLPDTCASIQPGTQCLPWWEEGQMPQEGCLPGSIGVCAMEI